MFVALVFGTEAGSCRADSPNKAYLVSGTLEQLNSDPSHDVKIDLGVGSAETVVSPDIRGIVEDSGNLVVRFAAGIAVLGPDGKVRRTLTRPPNLGFSIARVRPRWIAATDQERVELFATDGAKRIPFAHFFGYPRVRSLPNDELAVYSPYGWRKNHELGELLVFGGWPLKLTHRERYPANVTSVEPLSQSVIAVATGSGANYGGIHPHAYDPPMLTLYDRQNFKILAKRQLGEHGWINAMRAFDDQLVVSITVCEGDQLGTLRFLKSDLSDGTPRAIATSGLTSLAVIDSTHLAMGEIDCVGGFRFGSTFVFDSKSKRLQKINDRLSYVFQGDGS